MDPRTQVQGQNISISFIHRQTCAGGTDKCRKSDKMANDEFEEGSESQTCALLIDRGWKPEKIKRDK